jgi:hypothetical protein
MQSARRQGKLREAIADPGLSAMGGSVTLRSFWDSIPETRLAPLVEDQSRRTPLYLEIRDIFGDPHPLATVTVAYLPPWLVNSENGRGDLDRYLEAFPGARDYDSYVRRGRGPDFEPEFTRHVDGWGELQMNWQVAEHGASSSANVRQEFMRSITRSYRGDACFFPAIGRSVRGCIP